MNCQFVLRRGGVARCGSAATARLVGAGLAPGLSKFRFAGWGQPAASPLALRKGLAFPAAPLFDNLFFSAGRRRLPSEKNDNDSRVSPGKAEPFRGARGEAPRAPRYSGQPWGKPCPCETREMFAKKQGFTNLQCGGRRNLPYSAVLNLTISTSVLTPQVEKPRSHSARSGLTPRYPRLP